MIGFIKEQHEVMIPHPTHSLMIVSYAGDIDWLSICLKSLSSHASGFDEVVIVVPEDEVNVFAGMGLTREKLKTYKRLHRDGYILQQIVKIHADEYCSSEWITHIDSDCILTGDITPDTFIKGGMALSLKTPYGKCPDSPWRECTEKAIQLPAPFETMRRHGITYHWSSYAKFREHIKKVQGKSIVEYLQAVHRGNPHNSSFSEFNAIGSFLIGTKDPLYLWIDTTIDPIPPLPLIQFWSYGHVVLTLMRQKASNEQINAVMKSTYKFTYPDEWLNELRKLV